MDSLPPYDRPVTPAPRVANRDRGPILWTTFLLLGVAWLISAENPFKLGRSLSWWPTESDVIAVPLAMEAGDPHVRALMRTISAAESYTAAPYHTLYGGDLVNDLTHHPDKCVTIVVGPNTGDCTTAAGRYQFLTTTWLEKADAYHPEPPRWYSWWGNYSFEPIYQDEVVYRWLSDPAAWNADIPELLRQGQLEDVLYLLSGTWTSLGYGIEDNSMTPHLQAIYQEALAEELQ
ncbi:MAG: glycoside hydrolase family protein [Cyanobacteria bacterium P01_H01_bin.162]